MTLIFDRLLEVAKVHAQFHEAIKTQTQKLCLCGSLAQCALSLERLSAGPGWVQSPDPAE